MEETMEQKNFSDIGPSQGSSVDLNKYDKKPVKIEKVSVIQVPSKFTELIEGTEQHHFQWVLKVESEVLETLEREGEETIEFRASELFNLIQNKKGELEGFPAGEGSNLMIFMKDLKIGLPEKMENLDKVIESIKGKDTLVKTYEKEKNGNSKTFLKFRYN